MSAKDVLPYISGDETGRRSAFRTNITAAVYREGEPVTLDGSNELVASHNTAGANDPVNIQGIAAEPAVSQSNRMAALEIEDTVRTIYRWDPANMFICRYFATGGAGALVTPTHALVVGQTGNLVRSAGGDWAFDTGAANSNCVGEDVLDADGNSLKDDLTSNGTGVYVVIRPL